VLNSSSFAAADLIRYAANLVSRNPMSAVDVTLKFLGYALFPYSGIIETLTDGLIRSAQQTNDVAASGDIEKMEAVERRQELEMSMAERQAKVAQELAVCEQFCISSNASITSRYTRTPPWNATSWLAKLPKL
jgi:hypothetical protein